MKRVHELEIMVDEDQVRTYVQADFEEAHALFVRLFQQTFGRDLKGFVLDLGCGPGHIALRMARAFPDCIVHGVDGSETMLRHGKEIISRSEAADRVVLMKGILPRLSVPRKEYDVIISNSVLHHLRDPQALWQTVKRFAREGAAVFMLDLKRPPTTEQARQFVEKYAAGSPEALQRDFYNSFLAAFEPVEVKEQLKEAGLDSLTVQEVSDRHVAIYGYA